MKNVWHKAKIVLRHCACTELKNMSVKLKVSLTFLHSGKSDIVPTPVLLFQITVTLAQKIDKCISL